MLKLFKLSKSSKPLAFIIAALLITVCCGKRKPPLPPVDIISQRVEITGTQQGNKILLVWNLPNRNSSNQKPTNINRADIYRLFEPVSSPLSLTEEEFAARSNLIATVPITDLELKSNQVSYTDILEFAGQPARIRYAIRFVNSSNQKASFSNFLLIEPTATVADVPKNLVIVTTKDFLLLTWNAPTSNVDGSKPANILGYNIYRSDMLGNLKMLNNAPVLKNDFSDKDFKFENEYRYFVRTVSLGAGGEPIESLDSNLATITARDIFPPNSPNALTIAAAPNNLSIFFAFNNERDVAGYKVYRTINPSLPKAEWLLLNSELLTANTFQDTTVESGKTYFYYLIAVDNAGNMSESSEIVSETAP